MLGGKMIHFCKGPLLDFGASLDEKINRLSSAMIHKIKDPAIELRLTPMAIGLGVFISVILFSSFLILRI